MKRELFTGLLTGALLLGSVVPAAAAVREVPVQVDGVTLSEKGRLEDGVTYVPLRSLLDAFGGWELRWDADSKSAVAVSGERSMIADPAADTVHMDGHTYEGGVYVLEGRTYVPARLVATVCGGGAAWDRYMGGAAVTSPGAEYDAQDLYWLSRIVSAESQGEPETGQVAVGSVVLNRVASDTFPDTVSDVIFDQVDGVQFEPVYNGTVYLEPTAQAVESAKQALNGEAPVGECLYFYAPALSQGLWVNANRDYYTTIGCHRFYL